VGWKGCGGVTLLAAFVAGRGLLLASVEDQDAWARASYT
jgi:hypothetical protein